MGKDYPLTAEKPQMIHSLGKDQRVEYVNDYWLEVLQYDRSEVIGQPFSQFLCEDSQKKVQQLLPEFEENGILKNVECGLISKTGEVITVAMSATIAPTLGNYYRTIATMTPLHLAENEDAQGGNPEFHRDMALTAAGIGVFEWDVETGVAFTDEEILHQFGFGASQSKTSQAFWRTQLGEEVIAKFNGYDQRQPDVEFEFDYKTELGEVKVFKVVAKPLFNGNSLDRITGVCMEITSHKEMQNELLAASKLAALGQLSAGVAHEINNPLAIIRGSVQYSLEKIKENSDPEELVEILAKRFLTVEKMVDRMASIVSGLRMYASDPNTVAKEDADISHIVESSMDFCRERYNADGVSVHAIVDSMPVRCNSVQLTQTFLSILGNAFEAIQDSDEKWIRVWGERVHDNAVLRFVDSGAGVSEEIADRIMDPFFTTKQVNQGKGLGLSMAKGTIEEHGGKLYLDARAENTTIVIELPLALQAREAA